jgi:hypothetical protein
MNEVHANLWDMYKTADAICCTTNNIVKNDGSLVMGAGIAKDFAERYPFIAKEWGRRVLEYRGVHPFVFTTLMKEKPHLVYFGTKYHWKDPSDLELIEESVKQLCWLIKKLDWQRVLLPRPGCKRGQLDWHKDVLPRIGRLLDDNHQIIIISQ